MIENIIQIFSAIWQQDFSVLMNGEFTLLIYAIIGFILFLESGFIPASPLPCDSVVILAGILAAMGVLDPVVILMVITLCAALGSEAGYWQGKKLNDFPKVRRWVAELPQSKVDQVDVMLTQYGFLSLFIARFVPIARSLLPLMMGVRNKDRRNFHWISFLSAFVWTGILMVAGYVINSLPESYSQPITSLLMLFPLTVGVISVLLFAGRKLLTR